ncbi:MAG TPA: thioredoxin family protein [Polyangia bacterium]|nr:thioredoxin family protein [Polyangia bacterium]
MRFIAFTFVVAVTSSCAHRAAPVIPAPAAQTSPRSPATIGPPPTAGTMGAGSGRAPSSTRDPNTRLAEARQFGRRALLVFCAEWSMACLEMSRTTFTDPRVVQQLSGRVMPVPVDLTRGEEDSVAAGLEARYRVTGTPVLILLDAAGRELARADRWLDASGLLALLATNDLPPPSRACPKVLAQGQSYVTDLAVWGDHLYWVAEGTAKLGLTDGAIRRIGLDGLGLETLADVPGPRGLLVDATGVFWTAEPTVQQDGHVRPSPREARAGTLWFLPNGGGTPRVLVRGLVDPRFLQASADRLFVSSGSERTVLRVSRAGGGPQSLGEAPGRVSQIALDATHVYFTIDEYHTGKVGRVSRVGGPVEILASGLDRPWGVVLDDSYVYFASEGGYRGAQFVARVAKQGGPYESLALLPRPKRLAIQGEWLYAATEQGIAKLGRAGTPARFLSSTEASIVAVDGAYVYAADASDAITCIPDPRE